MSIHLISGAPGSGKTLRAVQGLYTEGLLFKLKLDDGSNRPIYVVGLDGELPDLAYVRLDYGFDWRELEDGSLVVVDEAHYQWPAPNFSHLQRGGTSKTDQEKQVLDLSMHRHRGFDFILTSQNPFQLHWAIKGFVTRHEHIVLRRGTRSASNIFSMNEYFTYSADRAAVDRAKWQFPKSMFDRYRSAEIHDKRSSPMLASVRVRLWIVAGLVTVAGCAVWYGNSGDSGVSVWDYGADQVGLEDGFEDGSPLVGSGSVGEPFGLREFVLSDRDRGWMYMDGWCVVEGLSDHPTWSENHNQCAAIRMLEGSPWVQTEKGESSF